MIYISEHVKQGIGELLRDVPCGFKELVKEWLVLASIHENVKLTCEKMKMCKDQCMAI